MNRRFRYKKEAFRYNSIKIVFFVIQSRKVQKMEDMRMNRVKKSTLERMAKLAYTATSSTVNATCRKLGYQPVMPKESAKLKKHV